MRNYDFVDSPVQVSRLSPSPFRRFYAAISLRALQDLGSNDARVRADAARWFLSPDDPNVPVSLNSCLQVLGFTRPRPGPRALKWAGLA